MGNENNLEQITILIKELAREVDLLRKQGRKITGGIGPVAYMVVLSDTGNVAYTQAVQFIQNLGVKSVPGLTSALIDSPDSNVRMSAAILLCELRSMAASAVPSLIEAFKDEDWEVRCWSVIAVAGIGPEASPAIPSLIELLTNLSGFIIKHARIALVEIGSAVVPAVIDILNGTNSKLHFDAAIVLKGLGPAAISALPTLLSRVKSESGGTQAMMIQALGNIRSKEALPVLEELLNEDRGSKASVTQAIEEITNS